MKNILTVIGTRPEAIKLIPLVTELNSSNFFKNKICITKQHSTLLSSFNIKADYQFKPCKKTRHYLKVLLICYYNLIIC